MIGSNSPAQSPNLVTSPRSCSRAATWRRLNFLPCYATYRVMVDQKRENTTLGFSNNSVLLRQLFDSLIWAGSFKVTCIAIQNSPKPHWSLHKDFPWIRNKHLGPCPLLNTVWDSLQTCNESFGTTATISVGNAQLQNILTPQDPQARLAPEFFASQDEFFDANLSDTRSKTTISTTSWINFDNFKVTGFLQLRTRGPVQVSSFWDGHQEWPIDIWLATCNDERSTKRVGVLWTLTFLWQTKWSLDLWKRAALCFTSSAAQGGGGRIGNL